MKLTGQHIIGFARSGLGKSSFTAINPATLQPLETSFPEATEEEVSLAVGIAEQAARPYRLKMNEERAHFLETIAEEIMLSGDRLIQRCMQETALPEGRLIGERTRTVNQLKFFAAVVREGSWVDARIDPALPDRKPLPRPDIRQMHIPLGPVGIFGASNFPLAFSVAGGDTSSALAAGCPVVVKGHPLHPGTSELVGLAIAEAARKTGMPEGIFSLIQGTSVEVGMALVKHPFITAIGFTGSFRGGKAIFDAASQRPVPIPVFAEMGSSNPVFVLSGALKDKSDQIASGLCSAVNLGVGQFCTNPGLLVVEKSADAEAMITRLGQLISESDSGIMLGEGIKRNFEEGIGRLARSVDVKLIAAGSKSDTGYRAQPKFFLTEGQTFLKDHLLSEEVFGPATLAVYAEGKDELLRIAESLSGHLTATIHGNEKDLSAYSGLIPILERKVGRLIFNGYPTGVEVGHAMIHGGPYPATTASQTTSVGSAAIRRFARPVCYQDFPQSALPDALKDSNPLNIRRLTNGK